MLPGHQYRSLLAAKLEGRFQLELAVGPTLVVDYVLAGCVEPVRRQPLRVLTDLLVVVLRLPKVGYKSVLGSVLVPTADRPMYSRLAPYIVLVPNIYDVPDLQRFDPKLSESLLLIGCVLPADLAALFILLFPLFPHGRNYHLYDSIQHPVVGASTIPEGLATLKALLEKEEVLAQASLAVGMAADCAHCFHNYLQADGAVMVVVLECDKLDGKPLGFGLLFLFLFDDLLLRFGHFSLLNALSPGLNCVDLLLFLALLLRTIDTQGLTLPHTRK